MQLIHEAPDHLPGLVILDKQVYAAVVVLAAWNHLIFEAPDHHPGLVILDNQVYAAVVVLAAWDQLIYSMRPRTTFLV